jgi:hypothetical protein
MAMCSPSIIYQACLPGLSDALCRLASGGSFAVRKLYTDDEEVLFKAARPTLLNGIEEVIGRSDLADCAIFLTLGPIAEGQRRSETELWRNFELARRTILDALLDAAAHGLRAVGSVQLARLPRMADFALWATACKTGLWPAGAFTRAYAHRRQLRLAQKSARSRRPSSGADISSRARHRDYLPSRRPCRKQSNQDAWRGPSLTEARGRIANCINFSLSIPQGRLRACVNRPR